MTEPKYGSCLIEGISLSYMQEGAGRPLLVAGSSIYYPRTFSQYLRQSCSLTCVDLPHFVPLDVGFDYALISFDFYARCIETLRAAAELERVVIVGHSHHGNVALEYAKRFPANVSHIVLIGVPPVNIAGTIQGSEEYWALRASESRKQALEKRRSWMNKEASSALSPEADYISRYVADSPLYWNDPQYDASWLWEGMAFDMNAIHAFRDLFRDYEITWDSNSLKAPVLVVMGENDYAVPPTLWDGVLPELENVTVKVLKHSGHTPQLEQADEFDRLLLGWLQN